jgi:succinate dehydrogenase / fumarate reductase cytochrome b subunit
MAQAHSSRKARPLSPHLQIWRWGPGMTASILHRATGNALAVAGLGTLLCWLGSLAAGPEAYARFQSLATSPLGWLVLVGISWSFFNHLCSGLRHLVLDIGAGYELENNNRWAAISPVLGIVFTAMFWAVIFYH